MREGGEGGRKGGGEEGVEEKEKGHTINELCILVLLLKFIMFYHILFHLERRDRVQSK